MSSSCVLLFQTYHTSHCCRFVQTLGDLVYPGDPASSGQGEGREHSDRDEAGVPRTEGEIMQESLGESRGGTLSKHNRLHSETSIIKILAIKVLVMFSVL